MTYNSRNSIIKPRVDEDKLYDKFREKMYNRLFQYIILEKYNIQSIFTFSTDGNPIEWLLLNNLPFLIHVVECSFSEGFQNEDIARIALEFLREHDEEEWSEYGNFDIETAPDIISSVVDVMEEMNTLPAVLAHAVWNAIKNMECGLLGAMIINDTNSKNMHQIMRIHQGLSNDLILGGDRDDTVENILKYNYSYDNEDE